MALVAEIGLDFGLNLVRIRWGPSRTPSSAASHPDFGQISAEFSLANAAELASEIAADIDSAEVGIATVPRSGSRLCVVGAHELSPNISNSYISSSDLAGLRSKSDLISGASATGNCDFAKFRSGSR